MHILTGGVMGAGIVIAIASVLRWYVIYLDPSNAFFGIALGLSLFAFGYIYNWMKNKDIELNELNKKFQAIVSMWTKNEKEDIKSIAEGKLIE